MDTPELPPTTPEALAKIAEAEEAAGIVDQQAAAARAATPAPDDELPPAGR